MNIKKITILVIILLTGCFLSTIVTASAEDDITAQRAISDNTSLPGETFTVTIVTEMTGNIYGPILDEDLPSGWNVIEISNDGATYNELDISWLWSGQQMGNKTLIYNVTIFNETAPGDYELSGLILGTITDGTTVEHEVIGDSHVTIEEIEEDILPTEISSSSGSSSSSSQ